MYRSLLLFISLLLTACQSLSPGDGNLLFRDLRGGTFALHREVVIAPGYAHIVFQHGVAAHGASEYEPRCELGVKRVMDIAQAIPAGTYRIGTVYGLRRYVNRPAGGTLLAAAGNGVLLADSSSNEWYMDTYRMQLLSEEHEDPPVLTCGGAYSFPFYARYPTLQEMRHSLGEYATLGLRQPPP
jgi:hypothetical protein